jgi:hypothetical protein
VLQESIRTEHFLAHPDSLVSLRRVNPTIDGMYRYEAITNNNLIKDKRTKDKRTTMLLTAPWVKRNFDKEYLAEHQKLQDLNGWVDIRNTEANPTRKIRNAAIQFRDGLKAKNGNLGKL